VIGLILYKKKTHKFSYGKVNDRGRRVELIFLFEKYILARGADEGIYATATEPTDLVQYLDFDII
jgi:hypothetical protein